ncbi:MAG: hypothetical protein LRY73_15310 [Bacillus sp. (in: Bacteria)]|nr:hypothetical protein [Bacillus sp. (in: firmicutes)]
MPAEIMLIIFLLIVLFSMIGLVLLIVLWLKSDYRKRGLKIRELQKEIDELKRKGIN